MGAICIDDYLTFSLFCWMARWQQENRHPWSIKKKEGEENLLGFSQI